MRRLGYYPKEAEVIESRSFDADRDEIVERGDLGTLKVTKWSREPLADKTIDAGSVLIHHRNGRVTVTDDPSPEGETPEPGAYLGTVRNEVDLKTGEVVETPVVDPTREFIHAPRPGGSDGDGETLGNVAGDPQEPVASPQETATDQAEQDVWAEMAADTTLPLHQRIRASAARAARATGRGVAAAPGRAREIAASAADAGAFALTEYQAGAEESAQARLEKERLAEEERKALEKEKKRRAALPAASRGAESLTGLAAILRRQKDEREQGKAKQADDQSSGGGEGGQSSNSGSWARRAGRLLGGTAAAAPRGGAPKRKASNKGRKKGSKNRKNDEMSIVIRYERLGQDERAPAASSYQRDDLARRLFG